MQHATNLDKTDKKRAFVEKKQTLKKRKIEETEKNND